MNIRRISLFVFVLLLSTIGSRQWVFAAETISNMYEALVPLEDRTNAGQQAALRKGLEQVLIRYSGYSGAGSLDGVAVALANAENYVVEFSAETHEVPAEDGLSVEDSQFLWIRYNASQIDQLAQQYQLPIWPALRPTVRYMVLQELWDQPTYMSRDTFPAMAITLENLFAERGIPASTFSPRLIGADRAWDLSDLDAYTLLNEAESDLLVIVRVLSGRFSGTQSEVVVVQDGDLSVLREQAGGAIPDVDSALNQFVDSYSLDQAFLGGVGQSSEVFISVLGLENFGSYRRFLNVLLDVDQVTDARLEAQQGDQTMFRVTYGANHDRLIASIQRQIDLEQLSNRYGALGTRRNPYLLAVPGYQLGRDVDPIFFDPIVEQPSAPVRASESIGSF